MNQKTYSVMSFNIHNFLNSEMKDSTQEIFEIIKNYDIIALQEVYHREKLAEIVKGYNYSYNKGNLIMTKFPIQQYTKASNERFTSLLINLPLHQQVFVTNIHLNYQNEQVRNEEIDEILEKINTYTDEFPSILLGDFNALTKSDYSSKEWSDIYRTRKYGQWELPVHELTDKLNHEWYDCGKSDKHVTSRYNTRIDYVYTKNMQVFFYNVVETMPQISDHNLVEIKFN